MVKSLKAVQTVLNLTEESLNNEVLLCPQTQSMVADEGSDKT